MAEIDVVSDPRSSQTVIEAVADATAWFIRQFHADFVAVQQFQRLAHDNFTRWLERHVKVHELKCWPSPFSAMWDGRKRFELRRNDRGYRVGDVLHLREYVMPSLAAPDGRYTGREMVAVVTYALYDHDDLGVSTLMEGVVVMGMEVVLRTKGTA